MEGYRQVKIFEAKTIDEVEKMVNEFLIHSGKEALEINYSSNSDKYSVLILYREINYNG